MVVVDGVDVVVVEVPVVLPVSVSDSRLKAVPWRKPETTALACSSPPRNSANSALSLASVVVDVPMAVVVADGLVERVSCDSDRRGAWASLTHAGHERLRSAAPVHLRGVAEHFLDRLTRDELGQLDRLLRRVVDVAG